MNYTKFLCFTILLIISVSASCSSNKAGRKLQKRVVKFKHASIGYQYFRQKLTHFNETDNREWLQRFIVFGRYYKPNGPVLFEIRNNHFPENSRDFLRNDLMVDYAKRHGGLVVSLEKRFDGQGFPTPDLTDDNMRLITKREVIEDATEFITWLKTEKGLNNKTWVLFAHNAGEASLAEAFKKAHPEQIDILVTSGSPFETTCGIFFIDDLSATVDELDWGNCNKIFPSTGEDETAYKIDITLRQWIKTGNCCDNSSNHTSTKNFQTSTSKSITIVQVLPPTYSVSVGRDLTESSSNDHEHVANLSKIPSQTNSSLKLGNHEIAFVGNVTFASRKNSTSNTIPYSQNSKQKKKNPNETSTLLRNVEAHSEQEHLLKRIKRASEAILKDQVVAESRRYPTGQSTIDTAENVDQVVIDNGVKFKEVADFIEKYETQFFNPESNGKIYRVKIRNKGATDSQRMFSKFGIKIKMLEPDAVYNSRVDKQWEHWTNFESQRENTKSIPSRKLSIPIEKEQTMEKNGKGDNSLVILDLSGRRHKKLSTEEVNSRTNTTGRKVYRRIRVRRRKNSTRTETRNLDTDSSTNHFENIRILTVDQNPNELKKPVLPRSVRSDSIGFIIPERLHNRKSRNFARSKGRPRKQNESSTELELISYPNFGNNLRNSTVVFSRANAEKNSNLENVAFVVMPKSSIGRDLDRNTGRKERRYFVTRIKPYSRLEFYRNSNNSSTPKSKPSNIQRNIDLPTQHPVKYKPTKAQLDETTFLESLQRQPTKSVVPANQRPPRVSLYYDRIYPKSEPLISTSPPSVLLIPENFKRPQQPSQNRRENAVIIPAKDVIFVSSTPPPFVPSKLSYDNFLLHDKIHKNTSPRPRPREETISNASPISIIEIPVAVNPYNIDNGRQDFRASFPRRPLPPPKRVSKKARNEDWEAYLVNLNDENPFLETSQHQRNEASLSPKSKLESPTILVDRRRSSGPVQERYLILPSTSLRETPKTKTYRTSKNYRNFVTRKVDASSRQRKSRKYRQRKRFNTSAGEKSSIPMSQVSNWRSWANGGFVDMSVPTSPRKPTLKLSQADLMWVNFGINRNS